MQLIDNKYRVLRELGSGGYGTVYVCWSESLAKEVAVKLLRDPLRSPTATQRFRQEAHALTLCDHPSIVRILSFGICDSAQPYFVMDYLEGQSLDAEIRTNGPLTPQRFAAIFSDVLSALECAHNAGFIHRDIKPSNIVLTTDGGKERAVVIDFGAIKNQHGQGLTATNALLGTLVYMSPEQCMSSKELDARSDLYSLSCTMYETATGKPPFEGDAMELMNAHLSAPPLGIPTLLLPLLERGLQKEPEARFASAAEMLECLKGLKLDSASAVNFGDLSSAPLPVIERKQNKTPSKRTVVAAAVLATTLGIGWLVQAQLWQRPDKPREYTPAQIEDLKKKITRAQVHDKADEVNAVLRQYVSYSIPDRQGKRTEFLLLVAQSQLRLGHLKDAIETSKIALKDIPSLDPEPARQWEIAALFVQLNALNQLGGDAGERARLANLALASAEKQGNRESIGNVHIFLADRALEMADSRKAGNEYRLAYDLGLDPDKYGDKVSYLAPLIQYGNYLRRFDPSNPFRKRLVEQTIRICKTSRKKGDFEASLGREVFLGLATADLPLFDKTMVAAQIPFLQELAADQRIDTVLREQFHVICAHIYNYLGQKEKARAELKLAIEHCEQEPRADIAQAYAIHVLLDMKFANMSAAERIAWARKAFELVKIHPDHPTVYHNSKYKLAVELAAAKQYHEAYELYLQCARTGEDAHRKSQSHGMVRDDLVAITIDPYIAAAHVCAYEGKKQEALTLFARAEELLKDVSPLSHEGMAAYIASGKRTLESILAKQ